MQLRIQRKLAATLAGTALVSSLGAGYAAAVGDQSQIFTTHALDAGYLLAVRADTEGKCGEGKCGEAKSDTEGKCGEGKCGEGKCGEGKCGSASDTEKDTAEGKCGEGKCGGAA